jgi:hypothetical protein
MLRIPLRKTVFSTQRFIESLEEALKREHDWNW